MMKTSRNSAGPLSIDVLWHAYWKSCGPVDECTPNDENTPSAQSGGYGARYAAVVEAYREMEPRVKAILFLHFFEHVSHQTIAQILSISRARVTQLIGQAVRRLTG